MQFSRMIQAGAVVVTVAFGAADLPAKAQGMILVVDEQGERVGILLPVDRIAGISAKVDAIDRMMVRDMAALDETNRELIARPNNILNTISAVGHNVPNRGTSWHHFEIVRFGVPGALCDQRATVTANGQSTPLVHVSSSGRKGRGALAAAIGVEHREGPKTNSINLIPSVNTRTAVHANEHAGSAL
ncbi:hypothetical protein HLH44_15245 [Gluconacetobacter sp. 1c LMG 22058]|uniref:Uncharacterized protein n=1 Tax=Gluconacetobacter dulcium TaxID=2729096 RepID=A0A7W4K1V2_9PROT|nr:hypothetical protein [Gluconacetobacter dulcium]MBB2198792.1 hypothetical protein [Gluconacetobacter dulcium]